MKIAIKFGDNDFYKTFIPVLKILFLAFQENNRLTIDKNRLCWLINSLSPTTYVAVQNHWEYNGLELAVDTETNKEYTSIRQYLHIKPENLLINEEVDALLQNNDVFFNSEIFILDTSLYNNNVYAI